MIIISLNIRGLRGGTKLRYMRKLISKETAGFICIQETKTKTMSDAQCFSMWGDSNVGWLHNEGENGAGSLLTMWHKEVFLYQSHLIGKGFIVFFGKHMQTDTDIVVVNVYSACNLQDKKTLWGELSSIKTIHQKCPWCFIGDFNAVRRTNERKGKSTRGSQTSEIRLFNEFIEGNLLLDIPIVGMKYTWFKANGSAKSRLDRVLVSEEWIQKWPMCKQYIQPREVSDHCAVVVKSMLKDWGPRPFRSIDAWFMESNFKELVKDKWNSYVVRQCDGSKSPGPDGFNLSFIQKNWETLKEDIYAAVSQFHESGIIPKGCNASFIALIPKVRDPMKLDQYRPISLVGSCYKIISKVLSNRIKKVLPSIIDECQSAFLKGRGMLDSVLMANEIVEDIMRNKKRGLCLEVDFEKAYDSGRWEFLYDMLQRLGFHHKWIVWIRGCLESASVSVLVNGSPTKEFKPTRGLRQ